MKIVWGKGFESSDEHIEILIQNGVIVLRDSSKNMVFYGQFFEEESAIDFKSQIQNFLSEVKNLGCQKEHLEFIIVYQKNFQSVIQQFLEEVRRFQISAKAKVLEDGTNQKLLLNLRTGEAWVSKPEVNKESKKTDQPIKVLIVEDSLPVQKILKKVFSSIPNVEIVGVESSPQAAVARFKSTKPDFVSLDIMLENGTGIDFLSFSNFKEYAQSTGARCALVTNCALQEHNYVADALELGASSYIQKPQVENLEIFAKDLANLLNENILGQLQAPRLIATFKRKVNLEAIKLIAIGSSTGGTEIISEILAGIPDQCPPIVIVQHMPKEFTGPYAQRIARESRKKVTEVNGRMPLQRNQAYLAAGETHMIVEEKGGTLYVASTGGKPVNRFMPSVSVLFDSVAKTSVVQDTIALMLTGMGSDGAPEMLALKRGGAITIGQSKDSCVVYGMPRAAEQIGALCFEASPSEMVAYMRGQLKKTA